EDAARIRQEIARAIPLYKGIETLAAKGDQVQWGGRTLYADGRFAMPDGKAHFAAISIRPIAPGADRFAVSTRRGKQFNSMVQRALDPLTGAARDDILISAGDRSRRGHAGRRLRLAAVSRAGSVRRLQRTNSGVVGLERSARDLAQTDRSRTQRTCGGAGPRDSLSSRVGS